MATVVEIINSALVTLGASTINSLDDDSDVAIAAKSKWDLIRRSELRGHPWNCCIKRGPLPLINTTPEFRYKYKFQLPTNCLRVLKIYEDLDYKLEGRTILSNKPTCNIKYVYDNTETATWDSNLVDVLSSRMAVELSYTIPRTRTMIDAMQRIYLGKLETAKKIDASEDYSDELGQGDNSFVSARFTG